ncbi:hypothetical protein MCANPG14_01413 [Mycoplasmopsis canis PG 14]|uniref:hypothetical protein n=1 Tax=Mycoplasmopsis canis TaxID=29555 RepID=UPI00025AEC02|nr:hypothetical protein [Mycoplasmopsis canis]EIE40623.1 hypothetical protein MCANPG14_01413 [Mycoplasmopsis canis PG 14]
MKFRNKLFIIGSIYATSTIAFVTSCSNNETKITNKNKENVESFEIVSYVEHNSNSSISSVTIGKANIIKKDNDTYWPGTKGITSDSTAQDKYNKVKKTVVEKINNYIQEKYLSNIKLPNKKENNLFVNINEISGMPKEIYVIIKK